MAKISDLLHLSYADFQSERALRKAVKSLADAANKRLKRLEQKGVETRATEQIYATGGRFSTRGKGVVELQEEFMRLKDFYKSPTSSLAQMRRTKSRAIKSLKESGIDITSELYDAAYKMYEHIRNKVEGVSKQELYYMIVRNVAEYAVDKIEQDSIYESVKEELKKQYEFEQERNYDYETSSFFRLDD